MKAFINGIHHVFSSVGVAIALGLAALGATAGFAQEWEALAPEGAPTARHEAMLATANGKIYLLGGRRINPVDEYDPVTNQWRVKAKSPIEFHHAQAVTVDGKIYIVGAMTGPWPNETPLDRVMIYDPESDRFSFGHEIPKERRRGGAGAVYHEGKIYLIGGITNGHQNGYVNWADEYDPKTGKWRVLPDAPVSRDHVAIAAHGNRIFVFGGRRSEHAIGNDFGPTERQGDVLDLDTMAWASADTARDLPTTRAGHSAIAVGGHILIGGGESEHQEAAHSEVQGYDVAAGYWRRWPSLQRGRHGTGFVRIGDYIYTASGAGNRGGGPELTSLERLKTPSNPSVFAPIATFRESAVTSSQLTSSTASNPSFLVRGYRQFGLIELDFKGPDTSETASTNPFTDYSLVVTFRQGDTEKRVLGFYAADGEAADSSADSGNVWRVRFTPEIKGDWTYFAELRHGRNIALQARADVQGEVIPLDEPTGEFFVLSYADTPWWRAGTSVDFQAADRGPVIADKGYLRFRSTGEILLKGGANSPENFLAYKGFDGTFRRKREERQGDATPSENLHAYASHAQDWREGDADWGDGKGKAIVGAINYLAEQGMNSVYFITMNIGGDGDDVWPYRNPDDFTRFDVSKLAQWNRLFAAMQRRGVLLHIVLQETENETLLDGGDTGPMRRLYLRELIARFGHHNGLIWNLGEENGPISWSPKGQNDDQRRAMAAYIKANDPYGHPVLLHTHANPEDKDHIAGPLLGYNPLDGLSLQIGDLRTVHDETRKWIERSSEAGNPWVLTMDEIGMWHTGAMPDDKAGGHDRLRRHALWGHLLAGGAGVEWYFGYKFAHNDLRAEDWRSRHELWQQTGHALKFFSGHVELEGLQPCPQFILQRRDTYCAVDGEGAYVVYLPETPASVWQLDEGKAYDVFWFDPKNGGDLQRGTIEQVTGGNWLDAGFPPMVDGRDWVALLRPID